MSVLRNTINLGNSIVGVSILSMPWCFKRCGIVLSILMIFLSGLVNRAACHLLLRSAIISRRRNPESLAYHTFGPGGKLLNEVGVLGFLVGTCVAYFVTLGDLTPSLVSQLFSIPNSPHLRAFLIIFLGLFIALPLSLLRRVDSLTSFSALSLGLYSFLVLKLFSEASGNLLYASQSEVMDDIKLWDSSAILSILPIFAMALSCQTQLFEIFDGSFILSEDFNAMKKMNHVIKGAINMVSLLYIMVGLFGYFAYYNQPFRGNILIFLPSPLVKFGFILTVVVSLPLCLFPCRTSLHSLLSRKGSGSLLNTEAPSTSPSMYMSDTHFRLLTIAIIVTTIGISIILPHIEFVLGIVGSTIGAIICFIFPGLMFIRLTKTNTTERIMAHVVSILGLFILVLCTISTLNDANLLSYKEIPIPEKVEPLLMNNIEKFPDGLHSKFTPKSPPKIVKDKDPIVPNKEKHIKKDHSFPFQLDEKKLKKQEELLVRIEKQQQEHKKLLEQQKEILKEIKQHDDTHHSENIISGQKIEDTVKNEKEGVVEASPKNIAIKAPQSEEKPSNDVQKPDKKGKDSIDQNNMKEKVLDNADKLKDSEIIRNNLNKFPKTDEAAKDGIIVPKNTIDESKSKLKIEELNIPHENKVNQIIEPIEPESIKDIKDIPQKSKEKFEKKPEEIPHKRDVLSV